MLITGKSVFLRAIEEKDFISISKSFQDEEILYMTGTRTILNKEQIKIAHRNFSINPTRYDFAICLLESGQIIGDLSISEIDFDNKKAVFRIALHHKENHGRGYGTEPTKLALRFTFEELKLNRLELQVFSHNIRGIRAYEKAGFKKEGILRQALFMNGTYSDEIIMSVIQEDYDLKDS
ncbi:GNAT family N-acetyltransferase [Terribacillus saccharophilus]|uniref:GNAT family N-acetyltransferase n=1 Tax=Terribacillus saccharophilus TaxID=361277 RepID=UPI001596166B|nr:GNAT family protein [Terribacillus saccharophilus]